MSVEKKRLLAFIAIVLILILGFVLIIINKTTSKSVIGSWKYEKSKYIYTFKKDGTGKYFALGTVMTFTYKIEKDIISIHFTGEDKPMKCQFSIKKNKLIIDDALGTDTVYIKYDSET